MSLMKILFLHKILMVWGPQRPFWWNVSTMFMIWNLHKKGIEIHVLSQQMKNIAISSYTVKRTGIMNKKKQQKKLVSWAKKKKKRKQHHSAIWGICYSHVDWKKKAIIEIMKGHLLNQSSKSKMVFFFKK